MAEAVTFSELGDLLAQLCAALGKPFGAKAEKMILGYHKAVERYPRAAVEAAVWELCRTWKDKKFPVPAHLAELCVKSGIAPIERERDPNTPTEPACDRCPECREWWGWHRVISRLTIADGLLMEVQCVRHTDRCSHAAYLERTARLYGWTFVDAPTPPGLLVAGARPSSAYGVLQLVPDPLPPTAPELELARRAARNRRVSTGRPAYDAPAIQPAPLAAALPAATAATEQGRILT